MWLATSWHLHENSFPCHICIDLNIKEQTKSYRNHIDVFIDMDLTALTEQQSLRWRCYPTSISIFSQRTLSSWARWSVMELCILFNAIRNIEYTVASYIYDICMFYIIMFLTKHTYPFYPHFAVVFRTQLRQIETPTEPEDNERKKKTLKSKIKGSTSKPSSDSKPNISYPTNFEHTVHVGFDAVTGEFTVSYFHFTIIYTIQKYTLLWVANTWNIQHSDAFENIIIHHHFDQNREIQKLKEKRKNCYFSAAHEFIFGCLSLFRCSSFLSHIAYNFLFPLISFVFLHRFHRLSAFLFVFVFFIQRVFAILSPFVY